MQTASRCTENHWGSYWISMDACSGAIPTLCTVILLWIAKWIWLEIKSRWERIDANMGTTLWPKGPPSTWLFARIHRDDVQLFWRAMMNLSAMELESWIATRVPVAISLEEGKEGPKALILIGGDCCLAFDNRGLCVSYYLRLARNHCRYRITTCRWFGAKRTMRPAVVAYPSQSSKMFKDLADHNEDLMRQVKETIWNTRPGQSWCWVARFIPVTGYSESEEVDHKTGGLLQWKWCTVQATIDQKCTKHERLDEYLASRRPTTLLGVQGPLDECRWVSRKILGIHSMRCWHFQPNWALGILRYLKKWKNGLSVNSLQPILVQRFGDKDSQISRNEERWMVPIENAIQVRLPICNRCISNFSGDWFVMLNMEKMQ